MKSMLIAGLAALAMLPLANGWKTAAEHRSELARPASVK